MKSSCESEIFEQPAVLKNMLDLNSTYFENIAEKIRQISPRFVLIAARGTSDNAAIYAKYLFGAFNKVPVALAMPSLYTHYKNPPDMRGGIVIGISQSGQTPDVLAVLGEAKKQGVLTISITNKEESPMAKVADVHIPLHAGLEKSVPASKTYTSQLAAIAMLSAVWKNDNKMISELNHLSHYSEEVLKQKPAIDEAARNFGNKNELVVIGRGFNHCTAYEIALKIKEMSYIVAEAYSAADFRHGPIAILDPGFPVIAVAPNGETYDDMEAMIAEISQKTENIAILTNVEKLLSKCKFPVELPKDLPEWISPIIATIPGQLMGLQLALIKGVDPDRPRGLKKVTLTY